MSYKLKIEFKGKYVQVHLSGEFRFPIDDLECWKKIVTACEKYKCYNILGESIRQHPLLSTAEAFDYQKIFKAAGIDSKYRIAWVRKVAKAHKIIKFMENVIMNRGIFNGKIFSNISQAKKWLLKEEN
jgi:hypothetical protein